MQLGGRICAISPPRKVSWRNAYRTVAVELVEPHNPSIEFEFPQAASECAIVSANRLVDCTEPLHVIPADRNGHLFWIEGQSSSGRSRKGFDILHCCDEVSLSFFLPRTCSGKATSTFDRKDHLLAHHRQLMITIFNQD